MTTDDVQADAPMFDMGAWLTERTGVMDRGEAAWLEVLADYDDAEGWAADGQLSCADWLMWRLRMGRSTAFEKLRIAHELRRRPQVAAAFAAGEISYSAVRALTRIDRPDAEVDEALLELANHHPIIDLERAVRCYQLFQSQDSDDDSFLRDYERRGIHFRPAFQGMGAAQLNLTSVELAEFAVALQMFIDRDAVDPVDPSPRADTSTGEAEAGDASSGGDPSTTGPDKEAFNPWWQRSEGGPTDVSNGGLFCDRHHTLVHHGFRVEGNANHELTFYRPDGTLIGVTTPPANPRYQAAA